MNIGRIVEQKGQAILIQAVARLLERGFDVKLVIVGDGPMRGDIEALIDRLGLTGPCADHRLPEQSRGL